METLYFTVEEISQMLKISYDKALDFVKNSGVEYAKIGRQYRVSAKKLDAFLSPQAKPLKKLNNPKKGTNLWQQ
jgi:excisionase family DNA binding protein